MKENQPTSSETKLECGHCGRSTRMLSLSDANHSEVIADYYVTEGKFGEVKHTIHITLYRIWHVYRCPGCEKTNVFQESWTSESEFDIDDLNQLVPITSWERLYPQERRVFRNAPTHISESLRIARRLLHVEPLAAAVFVGRTIEYVCTDRAASGKNLEEKIRSLAEMNVIPPRLAAMAQGSRLFRNLGAHASGIDSITVEDASILCDFSEAVLEYVYEAPIMLSHIEQRLSQLRQQETQWKNSQKDDPSASKS